MEPQLDPERLIGILHEFNENHIDVIIFLEDFEKMIETDTSREIPEANLRGMHQAITLAVHKFPHEVKRFIDPAILNPLEMMLARKRNMVKVSRLL